MKTQVYLHTWWTQYSCPFKIPKAESKYCGIYFSCIREALCVMEAQSHVVKLIWKTVELYVLFKLDKESFDEQV